MYHRLGHIEPSVTIGQRVKAGQQVGTNGTGNGQWSAHCHYDILRKKPSSWNTFVIGWSISAVTKAYIDPTPLRDRVMPSFDHYGYKWLDNATYNGKHAYHPGIDLNGKGAGNADLGDPICSPVDGVVVHVHNGTDGNGGWGDMVVIEELIATEAIMEIPSKLKDELGKYGIDVGDNIDGEKDLVTIKEGLSARRNENEEEKQKLNETIVLQKSGLDQATAEIEELSKRRNENEEEIERLNDVIASQKMGLDKATAEIEELSKRPESCPECGSTALVPLHPAEDLSAAELFRLAVKKVLPQIKSWIEK